MLGVYFGSGSNWNISVSNRFIWINSNSNTYQQSSIQFLYSQWPAEFPHINVNGPTLIPTGSIPRHGQPSIAPASPHVLDKTKIFCWPVKTNGATSSATASPPILAYSLSICHGTHILWNVAPHIRSSGGYELRGLSTTKTPPRGFHNSYKCHSVRDIFSAATASSGRAEQNIALRFSPEPQLSLSVSLSVRSYLQIQHICLIWLRIQRSCRSSVEL